MKKIVICLIIFLSLSTTACGNDKNVETGNGTRENHHNAIWNITQHYDWMSPIEMEENIISQIKSNLDEAIERQIQMQYEDEALHDYRSYLHKIWILNEWETEDIQVHDKGFSFYITWIGKGEIKGKISTGIYTARPNYYMDSDGGIWDYPEFSGTLYNGNASCYFQDIYGNEGILKIEFLDKNHITASVEYVNVVKRETAVSVEGQYDFRPYNLSDEESWRTINVTVERNLGIWGNVQIVGGRATSGRFDYGFAYIANEEGDIFYEFGAPFHTGAQIVDIFTDDYNGDGQTDVKLIEQYFANDINNVEWLFVQREDGTFNLKSN